MLRGASGYSSALAEATNMAFCTPFGKLELRSTIRARSDERFAAVSGRFEHRRLLESARRVAHHHGLRLERELRLQGFGVRVGREQLLLHSVLHLHPLFEREADCIRHGHDLVRSESYSA